MDAIKNILGNKITSCIDKYDAANQADTIALVTEWRQFRLPDWSHLKHTMRGNLIIDGRKIYNQKK